MVYGVTPTGFKRPRLLDVKQDLEQAFRAEFGPINLAGESVTGQIIGIQSKIIADAWEALEATYHAMYRSSATGVSLDRAVGYIGLQRNQQTATTLVAALFGAEGTEIPADAHTSLAETEDVFTLDQPVSIIRSRLLVADLEIASATDNSITQIAFNGVVQSLENGSGVTPETIASALAQQLDLLPEVTATAQGAVVTLTAWDGQTAFGVAPISGDVRLTRLGAPGRFTALEKGAISAPAGSLTQIDNPVAGWDSVLNLIDGATGEDVETDTSLRQRAARSVRITGSSTVLAIRSRLEQEVPSVATVQIYENRGLTLDGRGRPPKSFEAVVDGGDDQAVADMIWQIKPAGIETYGNTERIVVDSNGEGQIIRFSRPEDIYCWVHVAVDSYYPEESLPTDPAQAMKQAILATHLPIGKEVIPQRFEGRIHAALPGLEHVTVTLAMGSENVAPDLYEAVTLPMNERQIARFSEGRITVHLP